MGGGQKRSSFYLPVISLVTEASLFLFSLWLESAGNISLSCLSLKQFRANIPSYFAHLKRHQMDFTNWF